MPSIERVCQMFKNIYPLFERKQILKKEMLENIRDFPRNMFGILYQDYSDGILSGCEIKVRDDRIVILPGILCYRKTLYILEDAHEALCEATGRTTYLKVRFKDKESGSRQEEYLSEIILDEKLPEEERELELARFKLQEGARLRTEYMSFFDFGTEFDTVNRIYAPYASPGRKSIYPMILKSFAKSMMTCQTKNPWDISFCVGCIMGEGTVAYDGIKAYLNLRLGHGDREYANDEIYKMLKKILLEARNEEFQEENPGHRERKLLLI